MNFDDISRKIKKFSKDTVTEVQKLNEVRQLNARINDEKKKMNSIYQEIGKKIYDMYKEEPLDGFEDEIHMIQEKYSMIDLLQDQIRRIKGVALCPCCNTEVGLNEKFCSNCGSRMPEIFTIESDEDTDQMIEQQETAETLEGDVEDIVTEAVDSEGKAEGVEAENAEPEEKAEGVEAENAEPEEKAEGVEAENAESEGKA